MFSLSRAKLRKFYKCVSYKGLDSGDIINNDHEYSQESDEVQVTFAELGLAEDHFSHPEVCTVPWSKS